MWEAAYGIGIGYVVQNSQWQITSDTNRVLIEDLAGLGLPTLGNLKQSSDIKILAEALDNHEKVRRFLAGLTDTVGSLAPSHRHRVDRSQIISYEFKGRNFTLVADLTKLFDKIGCRPDQVLWNHPNFHSASDRYYKTWKKGFKLRVALRDYMLEGSFVSEAKQLAAEGNMAIAEQAAQGPIPSGYTERISINNRTTLHMDESSDWLPENLRGRHFVHYLHLGKYLGMSVSEELDGQLSRLLKNPERLFCPFTILTKGSKEEVESIIENENYLKRGHYTKTQDIETILMQEPRNRCILGIDDNRGFPAPQVIHAITYVILAERGSSSLKGKRILGNRNEIFNQLMSETVRLDVDIMRPNRGTCLLIKGRSFAALVGYVDNSFNKSLIKRQDSGIFGIVEPIFDNCVML